MSNTVFDTQKVRMDLVKQLQDAQAQYAQKQTMESLHLIEWLTNKISFIGSPEYYKRKAQS